MGGGGEHGDHVILHPGCGHKPCTDVASNLLSCNWMFALLAMACNRSFNMLMFYMRSFDISANFHPIFKRFSPLFLVLDGVIIISIE